ncbi:MAG: J domain-containing protein [Acidimicrobiales bacterium]|nr:J domain-containing protein [Acidimicrobiales bacterium]
MPEDELSPRSARRIRAFGRRRARNEADDSVQMDDDTGHAWWAQRDTLDNLVDPKPHGQAARARRLADAAFAPEGSTAPRRPPSPSSDPTRPNPPRSSWAPEDVFAWAAPPEPEPVDQNGHTPWDVLGLTSDASWPEVARRHRQLAKQHHPDRHGSSDLTARARAESTMSQINAAFSDLRRIYRLTNDL